LRVRRGRPRAATGARRLGTGRDNQRAGSVRRQLDRVRVSVAGARPGRGRMNGTRAERMRQPLAAEVVTALAEQHGVCIRPFTMEVGNPDTGELRYVPMPCGSTVESVCGPCARKARALRMAQCREGWHLDDEPVFSRDEPTGERTGDLAPRADLVALYRQAVDAGQGGDAD